MCCHRKVSCNERSTICSFLPMRTSAHFSARAVPHPKTIPAANEVENDVYAALYGDVDTAGLQAPQEREAQPQIAGAGEAGHNAAGTCGQAQLPAVCGISSSPHQSQELLPALMQQGAAVSSSPSCLRPTAAELIRPARVKTVIYPSWKCRVSAPALASWLIPETWV